MVHQVVNCWLECDIQQQMKIYLLNQQLVVEILLTGVFHQFIKSMMNRSLVSQKSYSVKKHT